MLVKQAAQWFWNISCDTNLDVFCTLLVFVVTLLIVKYVQWIKYIQRLNGTLPPGPWGIPIFGYLRFVKNPAYLHFYELSKKFGDIFSMRFGSELIVVLSDPRVISKAFNDEDFTGRPNTDFMNILEGYGIVNSEGALWKDQRKFLNKNLKNFGMMQFGPKRRNMDLRIMREVQIFLRELKSQEAPTNISPFLAVSISNVICSLTMNVHFEHNDSTFKRFMDLIDEGFKLFAKSTSANYIPFLRRLPGIHRTRNKISQNRAEMAKFFQGIIDNHRKTYNEGITRDIVDTYLHEIRQAENEGRDHNLFEGKNKDRQIEQILGDLFSAGMETVKNTLEWAIVFMLHNPEAARAVQDELDQVVGRTRLPSLEDLPYLPITEATIQEVLRRSNLVPLGTTHATTRDTELNGYKLPKGTHVIPLLYAVHMDPKNWPEPEAFRPSRFLTAEGKVKKPREHFMPFGVGRRMCLGATLAEMEIFLFFSSIMHVFDLRLPEGAALPSLRGNVGVTLSPKSFEVRFLLRDPDLVDRNEITINGPLRNIGSH